MSQNPHPARSPEFLSRLHDQELTAAERAHFESHRAHCSECRNAAAEFEGALALFRSTGPRPASPDLSARILRKLQQSERSSRRRLHFGPSFGIDLRWAGAFAVAVIAVIVASSVVVHNESRQSVLLTSPASSEAPATKGDLSLGAPKKVGSLADAPASRAVTARGRSGAEYPTDALASSPGVVGEKAREQAGADKDQKPGDDARFQEELFAKQKESGKAGERPPQVLPPASQSQSQAARLERDLREDSAAASNDRGQTSQTSPSLTASNAPVSEPRLAQGKTTENKLQDEGKRPSRAPAPKAEAGAARNDADGQNQAQSVNRNSNLGYAQAPPPSVAAAPRDAERAGGEGGTSNSNSNVSNLDGASVGIRLVVAPLDDAGAAPDVVPLTAGDVPASMKGQEFVVIVDMGGRVQQVMPRHAAAADSKRQNEKRLKKATPPPSPLSTLRFQPGARQRRLLVRVE
jgi:hypothetical protein